MNCPCGIEKPYSECCGRYHAGEPAPTAEALMRARYSAYVKANIDYLAASLSPDTRDDFDEGSARRWARESKWLGLQILDVRQGGESDDVGEVEFVARWSERGQELGHHERSLFRRIDGRWYFVEGHTPKKTPVVREARPKPNEPCSCGSGLKFKRCHGR